MSEYRALYRKWRPPNFDDVKGQDGITDILKYEVANDKLSHAYLFCGSRGTGKTSCAKILAKAVNCLSPEGGNPCNKCEACRSIEAGIATDVIEMDAASNNGISDVRDMQDEIAFTPATLKYRVYIIDEVHMMSTQAFNALLKTLEEPPAYVIFILATTEYNKLPTTIVSRCQRFDFKRISGDVITERLLEMSRSEGIEIDEDAARVIARVARGGMRDAISLLELCAGAHRLIDEDLVYSTVGGGNKGATYKIIESIFNSDYSGVYSIVDDVCMKSGDLSVFWQELIDAYRDVMVVKNTSDAKSYLDLTESEYSTLSRIASGIPMTTLSYHVSLLESALGDMQRAFNSKRSIAEITLTRMCDPNSTATIESLLLRVESLERELDLIKLGATPVAKAQPAAPEPKAPVTEAVMVPCAQEIESSGPSAPSSEPQKAASVDLKPELYSRWGAVLERIGQVRRSLSAAISTASVYRTGECSFSLKLGDFFAKKIASSDTDVAIIKGVIAEIEGKNAADIRLEINGVAAASSSLFSEIIEALDK